MNNRDQINIFIVEDNKVFTMALQSDIENTFKDKYIKTHAFETGEICMQKFNEVKPEIVILDYNLNSKYPDAADGIKVLDWIKKEHCKTNVIMLTSEDNIDTALKAFKHGASDYIVKTETKFKKINYSLFNLFKMMEAKSEAKRYKYLAVGLSMCITMLIGGILAVQIFDSTLLK